MNPEQFDAVCSANPDAVHELDACGHLIHMTLTGGETGARNSTLLVLLGLVLRSSGLALKLFDSSSGFRLPDGSVLSPDAALLRLERWESLAPAERRVFRPSAPIWLWNWPVPATRAHGALRPCTARWPTTKAMGPNWGGF